VKRIDSAVILEQFKKIYHPNTLEVAEQALDGFITLNMGK
jgi:hypothetical protein